MIFIYTFKFETIKSNTIFSNFNDHETINEKTVKFEGLYHEMSEADFVIEGSIKSTKSEIRFFINEPDEVSRIVFDKPTSYDTLEIAQEKLKNYREQVQELVYTNNLNAVKHLKDIFNNNITISHIYSMVSIEVITTEITQEKISIMNSILDTIPLIDDIYIRDIYTQNIVVDELVDTFPRINIDGMINSGTYTGNGITVGIVEAGGVLDLDTYSDYFERDILIRDGQTITTDHANHVGMIAIGNNGIARGSRVLSSMTTGGVDSYLTWMINEGANIINTSFGSVNDNINGTYSSDARLVDQTVRNYFITMVGSAGNSNTSPQLRTTSPKTGYNYVTVGNSNTSTANISSQSCFREQTGYGASKPNLVAPGYVTTNSYGGGGMGGTSFASPQVVGALALLMEEFPYLVAHPELNLAIITASASPMSANYNSSSSDSESTFDASGLHNQIGSGLLNYEKMREAANNYISITRPANSSTGTLGQTIEFNAVKNQRVRASLAWLAAGATSDNFTNYDLYLHRKNSNGTYTLLKHIDGDTNNVEFLDYTFGNNGNFRLSIQQKTANSRTDYIALSYVLIDENVGGSRSGGIIHTCYYYTEWTGSSSIHYIRCDCGYSVSESHSKYVVGDWEYCHDCNYSGNLDSHTHSYGAPYIPIKPINSIEMRRHYTTCYCGDVIIRPCMAFLTEPGETAYCYFCGQDMGEASIMIISELHSSIEGQHNGYCCEVSYTLINYIVDHELKMDLYFIERRNLLHINRNNKREKEYH